MSCSTVYFRVSGVSNLKVVDLEWDTDDLWSKYKDNFKVVLNECDIILEQNLVFNNYGEGYKTSSNFISQIVLCEGLEKGDFLPTTYAIVCYHHCGDPTNLEIVYEVARILKDLGFDLNSL